MIEEMDLNPVTAFEDGIFALDARITIDINYENKT
jgi:succinyl-CoA synthetase beta subunit